MVGQTVFDASAEELKEYAHILERVLLRGEEFVGSERKINKPARRDGSLHLLQRRI